jgi:alpha-1,6-mannosyltransferase
LTDALAPRAGLAAVAASVLLTFAVGVAGPSVMEPTLPGRSGQPPWALDAHLPAYLAVGLSAAALAAGAVGLVLVLRALRGGWSVPARVVLLAGLLAAVALTLVPPFGSSDQLSYAAYGRMLVTGHDPYTTTPAQLAALGDPVARAVQDWFTTSSVYGPLATAIQGLASLIGGTSARLTVFALGLANLCAFGGTGLLLHRMTRSDPDRQLRAALLWTANPLLLQLLVAGAHVDAQAVFFAVAAVAVMRGPRRFGLHERGVLTERASRTPRSHGRCGCRHGSGGFNEAPVAEVSFRAFTAGILVGLGFAVKVSDVLVGVGLAVALLIRPRPGGRRRWLQLAGLAAGFAVTAGAAIALGGPAMLGQLSRESDLVSIGSPWRVIRTLIHLVVGGTGATDLVKAGAVALAVVIAVLLIRGLPGPGETVVFAVVLAGLFAWPYVLPWYDALAWALLPLAAWDPVRGDRGTGEAVGWLLLARTTALGFGYLPARASDVTLPRGLAWMQPVIRHGVTPAVLAAATVWLGVLMLRSRRSRRPAPAMPVPGERAAHDESAVIP